MTNEVLKHRTRDFAVRVVKRADTLPAKPAVRVCASQLSRSGTSVAANDRASCKTRSKAEFIAKIGVVEGEADESGFWGSFMGEMGYVPQQMVAPLQHEATELTRIMAASRITSAKNRQSAIGNQK